MTVIKTWHRPPHTHCTFAGWAVMLNGRRLATFTTVSAAYRWIEFWEARTQ